MEDDA
jgi:hypothetical protein